MATTATPAFPTLVSGAAAEQSYQADGWLQLGRGGCPVPAGPPRPPVGFGPRAVPSGWCRKSAVETSTGRHGFPSDRVRDPI
jgi:hypothetical protein